jgi:2-desacetyl-2-hydroxyethyl bacteriochlorophyllide A dehydrogenase
MHAQALITDDQQRFYLESVILPEPQADQLLIRTVCTGVSVGTEFALIRNKISWGPYPLCTGYMGTGIVQSVGAAVDNFKPGDRVFFRSNSPMKRAGGEPVSAVSGTHCSHIVTRAGGTHGVDHLRDDAEMDAAAMFVLPAVGFYGVDMANPLAGQHVVVHGSGLIGLGVVAACATRGCVVTAVDVNPLALKLAAKFGADHLVNPAEQNLTDHVQSVSPDGADVVFECTGIPACIDPAIALCRPHGSFVWQGNYGSAPISMLFMSPHAKRLRMFFPCDDGGPAYRRAVIKNMARGTLPWAAAISHRIAASEAPEYFARINQGDRDILGLVIEWSR